MTKVVKATVKLTIEMDVGTWTPTCQMDQIIKQGEDSARARIRELLPQVNSLDVTDIKVVKIFAVDN